ncbi:MAG: hypothetical protein RLZZ546_1557, partial [Bacteroidota bacterium]
SKIEIKKEPQGLTLLKKKFNFVSPQKPLVEYS